MHIISASGIMIIAMWIKAISADVMCGVRTVVAAAAVAVVVCVCGQCARIDLHSKKTERVRQRLLRCVTLPLCVPWPYIHCVRVGAFILHAPYSVKSLLAPMERAMISKTSKELCRVRL
jgi:hypothetical protein